MSLITDKNFAQTITLEAPDEFILGLLGVLSAEEIELVPGELKTLSEHRQGWHLFSVVEGCGAIHYGDEHVELRAGQLAAMPAKDGMEGITFLASECGILLCVCICGRAADGFLNECRKGGGLFFPSGGTSMAACFGKLLMENKQRGSVRAQAASAAVYQVLSEIYQNGTSAKQAEGKIPEIVEKALWLIHREFAFLEGIADLAGRLAVSQEYLTRAFRRHVGMPPLKYLNQVRIEYAKQLLCEEGHSIAFAADACGFSNENYFARVFRTLVGVNPREYRKANIGAARLVDPLPDSFYVL